MELEDLQELDKKELERVKNIAKMHKNDETININIFYEDFNLKTPYTSYNQLSSIDLKPFQLRPYFKNIIVDI